jgi:hypothetical protein
VASPPVCSVSVTSCVCLRVFFWRWVGVAAGGTNERPSGRSGGSCGWATVIHLPPPPLRPSLPTHHPSFPDPSPPVVPCPCPVNVACRVCTSARPCVCCFVRACGLVVGSFVFCHACAHCPLTPRVFVETIRPLPVQGEKPLGCAHTEVWARGRGNSGGGGGAGAAVSSPTRATRRGSRRTPCRE